MEQSLGLNEVRNLLKKHGNKGARMLSTIGKQQALIQAFETPDR